MNYIIFVLTILVNIPFVLLRVGWWWINVVAIVFSLFLLIDTLVDYKISDFLGF